MNKVRREMLENIKGELCGLLEEEQEAFDNLPESFQSEERQAILDSLDSASSALEEIE